MGPRRHEKLLDKVNYMKAFIDVARVFQGRMNREEWEQHMAYVRLAAVLGTHPEARRPGWPESLTRTQRNNVQSVVSKRLSKRPVYREQLVALARHMALDRFLGGDDAAADALEDGTSMERFIAVLENAGWLDSHAIDRGDYGSAEALIAAFHRVARVRSGGLTIGPDAVISAPKLGVLRGIGLATGDDEVMISCRVDERIRIRVDVNERRALLLLDIVPTSVAPGYAVTCLAPSTAIPERQVARGEVVLPPNKRPSFEIHEPTGVHDLVAILLFSPLTLPWPITEIGLRPLSETQVAALLRLLKTTVQDTTDDPEIIHLRYRVER